jgi:lipopolysaccharide/colanic/teichoic acid biosynthesis glycosyltransferase
MAVCAVAIKFHDGGNIIYMQERLTKNGKKFRLYKFRSMVSNAESDGIARLSEINDNRITPAGKILRKYRLDEIPQLFNILKGDMSLVGPRPERPEIAKEYEREMPEFSFRLAVKAGLTGYAQVMGKYNTTPYDKLKMDLMYIQQYSVLLDFKILVKTAKIVFVTESTEGIRYGKTNAMSADKEKVKTDN